MIRQKKKKESKKIQFYRKLCSIFALIVFLLSVGIPMDKYNKFDSFEIVEHLQLLYIIVVGIFIMIASEGSKILSHLIKSFLKLFFSVWIMMFVIISSVGQLEQNIYIAYVAFIIGYFEILIETNDIIKDIIMNFDLKNIKLEFTRNEVLAILSIPLTIIIISVIHIMLIFTVSNSLDSLLLSIN